MKKKIISVVSVVFFTILLFTNAADWLLDT